MAAFFVGKTGAVAEYVMIYEYRYFVYLDNSQKYLDFLAEKALYPCRFRLVGKGLERETLCPFPRVRRFGTHSETGSKFLLLFSIKSKEGILCFAETVLNWRNTHVAQAKLLRDCAIFSLARMRPFKLPSSSTLSAFSANPPTAPSPAPHPPA